MNMKCSFKKIKWLLFLWISICCVWGYGQESNFKISPYFNGLAILKEPFLEIGPEFEKDNLIIRTLIRLSVTDKKNSIALLDKNTASWTSILEAELKKDLTKETGPIKSFNLGLRIEWGIEKFTFFPAGNSENEVETWKNAFAFEVKGVWYRIAGKSFARQWAPQFKIRYGRIWKKSDETGIVIPTTDGSPYTVHNMIIDPPVTSPVLTFAFALPYYPGENKYSFCPALYYNFIGEKNSNTPFRNSGRLRLETWTFFYPTNPANFRIGVAPYISFRTHGTDDADGFLYGLLLQVRIETNLIKFF